MVFKVISAQVSVKLLLCKSSNKERHNVKNADQQRFADLPQLMEHEPAIIC